MSSLGGSKERASDELSRAPTPLPEPAVAPSPKPALHPSIYIAAWIALSSSVIIFNKWILHTAKFEYRTSLTARPPPSHETPLTVVRPALFLTTWHLSCATIMTQILAHTTQLLDSRHRVPMTPQVYMRAILPIGVFFSLSLICGNVTYLYLSVSFIQMLKATNAVATLLATWAFGMAPPDLKTLGNVSFIVVGVVVASFGEIQFNLVGFIYQVLGILFEATRLVLVQKLLSSAEFKMDPMVSLYYFAPCCAIMNGICMLVTEVPRMRLAEFEQVGYGTFLINGMIAFLLNVSAVMLIGKTSAVVLTLSGVLKDILLVVASMMIFRDPVAPLQFVGYSMALAGLIYYRLGAAQLGSYVQQGRLGLGEYRTRHPITTRVASLAVGLMLIALIMGASSFYVPEEYRSQVLERIHHSHVGSTSSDP